MFLFPDRAAELVSILRNLRLKVEKEIEQHDDKKGNVMELFKQEVIDSSIPDSIQLKLPIIKGHEPITIQVEIYVTRDYSCQLVSPDLEMLKAHQIESLINDEIEGIKKLSEDIVIIYQ